MKTFWTCGRRRAALVFVLLAGWALASGAIACHGAGLPHTGVVAEVFDGDTVQLASGQRIRYLGIDTPEVDHKGHGALSQCYAQQAWRRNREWVLHKKIRLEYDAVTVDPHGRLLAYVYLPDGTCVNEALLRRGYGFVYRTRKSFRLLDRFLAAQRQAIGRRLGMWGSCPVPEEKSYIGNRRSFVFHRPGCPYGRRTSAGNRVRFRSRWDALEKGFRPCRRCLP